MIWNYFGKDFKIIFEHVHYETIIQYVFERMVFVLKKNNENDFKIMMF